MADGQVGPVLALEQAAGGEPAGGILLGVDHTLDASGLPVPQPLRPGAVLDGHGNPLDDEGGGEAEEGEDGWDSEDSWFGSVSEDEGGGGRVPGARL